MSREYRNLTLVRWIDEQQRSDGRTYRVPRYDLRAQLANGQIIDSRISRVTYEMLRHHFRAIVE